MSTQTKLLIVDDEPGIRFAVRDYFERRGFLVSEAADGRSAREAIRNRPDAIVLDYQLPDTDALRLIGEIRSVDPDVIVIVLTGHGTIELAVTAVKLGADNFLTKPVELPALQVVLERAVENARLRRTAAAQARRSSRHADPFEGTTRAIAQLRRDAQRIVRTNRSVLIQGETGSGKGVLARWIHEAGPRADAAFVDINCAGISRDLLESELFGHEKGAFTGAVSTKQGLLELAHGGSAFLDEIGDLDLSLQAKLLTVVEQKQLRRVGDLRDRHIDMRLIAATHRDLPAMAREGRFRSDLYFRLSTIRLVIPPLRARVEDIPSLAGSFLEAFARELGRPEMHLIPAAVEALQCYPWPGNIRELRNVIERAVLLADGSEIGVGDLRFDNEGEHGVEHLSLLADVERAHVLRMIEEEDGNVARAAKRLGLARSSLYQKLHKYARPDNESGSSD